MSPHPKNLSPTQTNPPTKQTPPNVSPASDFPNFLGFFSPRNLFPLATRRVRSHKDGLKSIQQAGPFWVFCQGLRVFLHNFSPTVPKSPSPLPRCQVFFPPANHGHVTPLPTLCHYRFLFEKSPATCAFSTDFPPGLPHKTPYLRFFVLDRSQSLFVHVAFAAFLVFFSAKIFAGIS